MNAPGILDRWGEPLNLPEDDDPTPDTTTRTRDEIHHERCAELRRILKDARDRREADQ